MSSLQCPRCQKHFSRLFALRRHIKNVHTDERVDGEDEENKIQNENDASFPFSCKRLRDHAADLNYLLFAKPKMCRSVIRDADRSLILCLCECAKNVLKGNVHLSEDQFCTLSPYKEELRELVSKTVPIERKKEVLQIGGILPGLLAPLLAPIIAPLASRFLGL